MEKQNWDEYLKAVFGDHLTEKDLEKIFLANPADAFAIYQYFTSARLVESAYK